jgi:magnesium-transporting ATPase (P-type)
MVPADRRLLESPNLRIQESALSGVSELLSKRAEFLFGDGDDNLYCSLPVYRQLQGNPGVPAW